MVIFRARAMTSAKKSPKEAKEAKKKGRKSGLQKGDPDPTKGAHRGKKGGRRRKKRRYSEEKPRDGRLDTEFTRVKAAEFRRAAFDAVDANAPPWRPKNQHGGRSNIDPRALAKCALLMVEEKKTLRDMVAYLYAHPDLCEEMGLDRVPSKSTLGRAVRRIPQRYLRKISKTVLKSVPEPRDGVKKTTIPWTARA